MHYELIKKSAKLLLLGLCLINTGFAQDLSGVLNVEWGDSPGTNTHHINYMLTTESGIHIPLDIPDKILKSAGGLSRLDRNYVSVTQDSSSALGEGSKNSKIRVEAISLLPAAQSGMSPDGLNPLSGSRKYVTIMCKFSDVSIEEQPLSFFQNMYGSNPAQLDHYWQEVSSSNINLAGSQAYGWFTLPGTRAYYGATGSGVNANLGALWSDCTSVADSVINFANFDGINLIFNDLLDCCAWGGSQYRTLDGVTKSWPSTWEPPWAWKDVSVMAHEMGHSFGLPHSNNFDLDSSPYDNPWTVMSAAHSYNNYDSVYGALGKHVNIYEKNRLNWIGSGEKYTTSSAGSGVFDLDYSHYAQASAGNYRLIEISLGNGKYYTIESRLNGAGSSLYEQNLAGSAVIIHHVDPVRNEPSWVVDKDTPVASFSDTEGVMWRVGETFSDPSTGVMVTVLAQTATGFTVQLGSPAPEVPTIISPVTGSVIEMNTGIEFSWQEVGLATSYDFFIWDRSIPGRVNELNLPSNSVCSGGICTVTSTAVLPENPNHKWSVRALNSAGASAYTSQKFAVQVPPVIPEDPVVISPLSGAVFQVSSGIEFTWNEVAGATHYDFYIWDRTIPGRVNGSYAVSAGSVCSQGVCSIISSAVLPPHSNHRWRVRASNSVGNSGYVGTSFAVEETPVVPDSPTPVSPVVGSVLTESTGIVFSWNEVEGATHYDFFIWDRSIPGRVNESFAIPSGSNCTAGVCSITSTVSLPSHPNHRWNVRASNSAGKSAYTKTSFGVAVE